MFKRCRTNFTLIELLVVMLLMGMLMTLMLPAFNRMINGNKVEQLASNLKLGLEQAQSHAVTSRRYVALILPNPQMKTNEEYWLGGCRLAYVDRRRGSVSFGEDGRPVFDRNTRWVFSSWVPDLTWREPVDGAKLLLLLGADDTGYDSFEAGEGLTVPDRITNVTMDRLIGIEDYLAVEGGSRSNVDHAAIIFSPYGGVVGRPGVSDDYNNLRLAVVEALANGNNLIFPSRDASNHPTNYMVLELNRFTGRVKYHNPTE